MIFKEIYTNKCFVDENILSKNGAGILRASFENKNQEEIVVHVPTTEFFELHNLSDSHF